MFQTHRFESGVTETKELQILTVMLIKQHHGRIGGLVVKRRFVADYLLCMRDNFNSIRLQSQIYLY
jgi:hypothetical protein